MSETATEPAAPATDPATPPTDPATPPADPATPPATDPATDPATPPADPATDPADESDPRVKRANQQAAQYRTQLRTVETELAQTKGILEKLAAVFNPGSETADPAAVAQEATQKVSALEGETTSLRAQLLVHELAAENGGNANALLDSHKFTTKLTGLDPAADDYRDQVAAAIKDAASTNPTLRAAGQEPSAGGAETAGQGAGSGAAVTADQFAAMTYAQRTELYRTNPALYQQLAGTAS